jgi:nucleoside-diphosphate-sugar epimerase
MSTLVTGAFGCIGARVVRALLAEGERPLAAGVGRTLEEFARLQQEGRLDARELG